MSEDIEVTAWYKKPIPIISITAVIVVIVVFGDVILRVINPPIPKSSVYGKWIEQNVAPYAREEFFVSARGITVNGTVVATDFKLTSSTFSYRFGHNMRTFEFVGEGRVTMQLKKKEEGGAHYRPVFKLEGRENHALR